MRPLLITGILVFALLGLMACGSEAVAAQSQPERITQTAETAEHTAPQAQIEYIGAVPEESFAPSGHPGQVVEITYDSHD